MDLYVQDFANDKEGITINSKGDVKKYTNTKIHEQLECDLQQIACGES